MRFVYRRELIQELAKTSPVLGSVAEEAYLLVTQHGNNGHGRNVSSGRPYLVSIFGSLWTAELRNSIYRLTSLLLGVLALLFGAAVFPQPDSGTTQCLNAVKRRLNCLKAYE
jgi:hypothetical protein